MVEKDPCESEHGLQSKSRLSTLEQLQYQLTSQVTQAGQRLCSIKARLLYWLYLVITLVYVNVHYLLI